MINQIMHVNNRVQSNKLKEANKQDFNNIFYYKTIVICKKKKKKKNAYQYSRCYSHKINFLFLSDKIIFFFILLGKHHVSPSNNVHICI